MLAYPPRVASSQSSFDLLLPQSSATPRALNFVGASQLIEHPTRRARGGFARAYRLRCRSSSSTAQAERLVVGRGGRWGQGGGKERHNELRSCRVAPISAAEGEGSSAVDSSSHSPAFDVETVVHHRTAALISSEVKDAAHEGEWQSVGRDGGVERLSTSSYSSRGASGLLAFNNGVPTRNLATAEFDQCVEKPFDQEGGTAPQEGLGLPNGNRLHNVRIIHHPQISNATEAKDDDFEGGGLESAQAIHADEQTLPKVDSTKKWRPLSVRKPSEEPPAKIDPVPIARQYRHQTPEPQPEPELQEEFEYYIPKVGDEVTGIVVSGTDYQLDIEIGAEHLGRMLSKDLKPFDVFRADEAFWELNESGSSFPGTSLGQIRFLGDSEPLIHTHPLVPVGTVLALEVLGVTSSGKAVLSARKVANRIAWHRVRQIHEQDEPIEVQCVAWNSDGLVFKIEGLRALLPLNEFLDRTKLLQAPKDYVGEWMNVLITDIDQAKGKLLVSEKRAWGWRNLKIGSLVVGTVQEIAPFGVEIILDGTSLRATLHISNISQCYIADIKSVFTIGEKVKALVIESGNPRRIGLSTANLESSRGLVLQDRQKVFQEAEEMAARHQKTLAKAKSSGHGKKISTSTDLVEEPRPANQDWFDLGEGETDVLSTSHRGQ